MSDLLTALSVLFVSSLSRLFLPSQSNASALINNGLANKTTDL